LIGGKSEIEPNNSKTNHDPKYPLQLKKGIIVVHFQLGQWALGIISLFFKIHFGSQKNKIK
jgi:hypothetical protein